MLINCSSAQQNYQESVSSLRFGQRAKFIKNTVKQNIVYTKKQLQLQIKNLKTKLKRRNTKIKVLENHIVNTLKQDLPEYDLDNSDLEEEMEGDLSKRKTNKK